MTWPDIGYAEAYLESYRVFARLRADRVIPAGVRFQVEYPTPLASIGGYIVPEQQQVLLGSYERAMFADLDRLLAAIPPGEVAVQWDVAVEFGVLEEAWAPGGAQAFDAIIAALARCVDQVPAEIPVGAAPVLRGLRPRALHAARIAGPAGPGGERGHRGGQEAGELRLLYRAAVPARGELLRAAGRAGPRIRAPS